MAKKNFNFKKLNIDLGNLKDTLTDTISTVADKVLDLADTAAEKSKIGQQIAKLFVEKKKEESALEEAYKELGKLYYDMHKTEAEGVLADLCMEIENTLINIEDITAEIEALKEANNMDDDDIPDIDDDDFEIHIKDEDDGFLERMADTVEEAFEGLDEAIEAALDKLENAIDPDDDDDDEIEVVVEEYADEEVFSAPEQDNDVEVEIVEIAEEPTEEIPAE